MIRRPIGIRPNTPAEDATRDTGDVAVYEYREQAREAGDALTGWDTWPQYLGVWDLWTVTARRKSWSSGRQVVLMTDGSLRAIRSADDYYLTTPPRPKQDETAPVAVEA